MAQSAPPPQQPAEEQQPEPPANQVAKLQTPPLNPKAVFNTGSMSASRAIEQAANAAAATRGRFPGDNGDLGLGQRQRTERMGPEILSDTMGVDFGPYMAIILREVMRNWDRLTPASAESMKVDLSIELSILNQGQVAGLPS